jgi:hypothetical protein
MRSCGQTLKANPPEFPFLCVVAIGAFSVSHLLYDDEMWR